MSHRGISLRAVTVAALVLALLVPASASAGVTTRSAVIARARTWVVAGVPYSQSRYARLDGSLVPTSATSPQLLGYRTDCSGFVSMALGFKSQKGYPLSLSTATLDNVLIRIKKNDLQRGDVILRPNDLVIDGDRVPYGHAVIFVRWVDAAKTRYICYHESGSRDGAVAAEIRWGTSGFGSAPGFAPYRYAGIDEAVRPADNR